MAKHFTQEQATDEAMLLLVRKMRRLHPVEFADVWRRLPDGACRSIEAAERRADVVRVREAGLTWEPDEEFSDEDD